MTRHDLEYTASNLLDGGWTTADRDEIKEVYNLTEDEICDLVIVMKEMEER